jgi:hypothetical protein
MTDLIRDPSRILAPLAMQDETALLRGKATNAPRGKWVADHVFHDDVRMKSGALGRDKKRPTGCPVGLNSLGEDA